MSSDSCDLCGLTLRFGRQPLETQGKTYRFCCLGCRQVFTILMEAADSPDPEHFKETELFRQCLELGIIPESEESLRRQSVSGLETETQKTLDRQPVSEPTAALRYSLPLNLKITNLWCPACAWVIDETLKKNPGVISASCNFTTDRLRCDYDPVKTSPSEIRQRLSRLGYKAVSADDDPGAREGRKEFLRFGISAFLTMNVMMLSFALYSGFFSELPPDAVWKISWPMFIMASIVLVFGGQNIFKRAMTGLFSVAGMETLIAVGSASAYLYSLYNLFRGGIHLYFDTAAMLITLVLLGQLLERRAKDRVLEDLENFFALRPNKVKLCDAAFPEGRYVNADQLQPGDLFRVEDGEIVPADGIITLGEGRLDESSLTGEPLPVQKRAGEAIRSGTRIEKGLFTVKALAVGEDSTLGQMIRIIEHSLGRKTPLEGRTDRILARFVPAMLGLAIATAIICLMKGISVENALIRAVTVLVISCPCALGVAIPLARVAGISAAGKIGILVRDFEAFEQAARIDSVVFDKTGTLTVGRWQLLEIISLGHRSKAELLSMAAVLEKDVDHPVAVELRHRSEMEGFVLPTAEGIQVSDNGISGWIHNKEVRIGSKAYLAVETGGDALWGLPPDHPHVSPVYMSVGGKPAALFLFGDSVRESARQTVDALRAEGYRLNLISGDGQGVTASLGSQLGLDTARGAMLPQDKAEFIERLRSEGHRVAMLGDGVNDAPALTNSDLAVAVHSGSHLGKEVADITLMRGEPIQFIDFLGLSRETNRKVQQNLWFSFCYNLVSIPIAMAGLLNPLVAVSAMLLSSLSVTGNTLLLVRAYGRKNLEQRKNPPPKKEPEPV